MLKKLGEKWLSAKQRKELIEINGSANFDSKFIGYLLYSLFEKNVLKDSSYGGAKSNFNKKSHRPLDQEKLNFIERLFEVRVGADDSRKKTIIKTINKICSNLRRSKQLIN